MRASSSSSSAAALASPQTALLLLVDTNEQAHYAAKGIDLRQEIEQRTGLAARTTPLACGDFAIVGGHAAPQTPLPNEHVSATQAQSNDDGDGDGDVDLALASAYRDHVCYALIERKTHGDLEASMDTTHYHDQRRRLVASGVASVVWMLLPGPMRDRTSLVRLFTTACHLAVGFPRTSIIHLPDGELGTMAHALRALVDGVHSHHITETSVTETRSLREIQTRGARPRFDTQRECWLEQLTVPRGMSVRKAEAVVAAYPTAGALLRHWRHVRDSAQPLTAAVPRTRKRPKTAADLVDEALADLEVAGARPGAPPQRLGPALSKRLRTTLAPDLDDLD